MKKPEAALRGGPPASVCGALVKGAGPAQVASSGPKAVKVTVPEGAGAGAGAPVTVARSEMGPPSWAEEVAWVAMVATACPTTDVSLASLQALVTGG